MASRQATERITGSDAFADLFLNLPTELRHKIFTFAHDRADPRLFYGMKMTLSSGKVREFVLVSCEDSQKAGSGEMLQFLTDDSKMFHEDMDPTVRSDYQAWKVDLVERYWKPVQGVLNNVAVLALVTRLHLNNTPRSSDPLMIHVERQTSSCLSKGVHIKDMYEVIAHTDDVSHTRPTWESLKWHCLDALKGLTVRHPSLTYRQDPLLTIKHLFFNLESGTNIADDKRLLSAWVRKHFGEKSPLIGRTFAEWEKWLQPAPAPLTADVLSGHLKDATVKLVPLEDLRAPNIVIRFRPRVNA